jgi:hypothetical protein
MEKKKTRKLVMITVDNNSANYCYDQNPTNKKTFLGRGQFGSVFKGNRLNPKKGGDFTITEEVAIKYITLSNFEKYDKEAMDKIKEILKREMDVGDCMSVKTSNHPNLVQVLSAISDEENE